MQVTHNKFKPQTEAPEVQYGKQIPLFNEDLSKTSQHDKILTVAALTPRERILLYFITKLTLNEINACIAFNDYLSKIAGIPFSQVTRVVSTLVKKKYLIRYIESDPNSKKVEYRELRLTKKTKQIFFSTPPPKNDVTPPDKNDVYNSLTERESIKGNRSKKKRGIRSDKNDHWA